MHTCTHTLPISSQAPTIFLVEGSRELLCGGCSGKSTGFRMRLKFQLYLFFMSSENLVLAS